MRLVSSLRNSLIIWLTFASWMLLQAQAQSGPDKATIVKLVREAQIFEPGAQINAQVNGQEVIVQSYLNPKANDNDCKIDAILIAKKIFDVYPPPAFSNVKVNLYDSSDATKTSFRSIIVRAGDVEVFSKGSISKEALLASLTVAHERRLVTTATPVSPRGILNIQIRNGARKVERQGLLNHIRDLQYKNQELGRNVANIDKCCELFQRSEAALTRSDQAGFVRAYNDTVIAVNQEQAKVNRLVNELNRRGPVKGPQYERRLAVFKRLEYLEQHGKDVTQLRRIFEIDVEPRAKLGQNSLELDVSLSTVERALSRL